MHRRVLYAAAALCALLGEADAAAQAWTPEQEVLAFMIRHYGRGAVVSDSAWVVACSRSADGCKPGPGVPVDAWLAYLGATREPSLLRDLLPPGLDVVFESEHTETPSTPCRRRKNVLTLSRPGISADGNAAVIWWGELVRIDHLGTCGASRGGVLLLRRNAESGWEVDRPLQMFIS